MVHTQWIHCPWKKKRKFPQYEILLKPSRKLQTRGRLVGARGAGGAMAPTDFDRSVNLITTRGDRLCLSHYCWPPRFSDFPTTLRGKKENVVNTCDGMWGGSCCFRFSDVLVADIEVPPSMTRRDLIFFSSVHVFFLNKVRTQPLPIYYW